MRPVCCAALLLVAGCAKRHADSAGYLGPGAGTRAAVGPAPLEDRPSPKVPPSPTPSAPPVPHQHGGELQPGPARSDRQAPAARRWVHYDGHARIRVTSPVAAVARIEQVAEDLGGRVDALHGTTITIRVPAGRFEQAWNRVVTEGDVLQRSVRADDITEQFTSVDLRVRTLTVTRERLVSLLAKATDEGQKLALLDHITRVTEELDRLQSQRVVLEDLAAMSRISVEVVAREAFVGTGRPPYSGMEWVAAISPFRRAVFDDGHRVRMPEIPGLVSLGQRGPFIAESADGAVLWTSRLPNDPAGDGVFWSEAIRERFETQFSGTSTRELGAWTCVDLDEAGAEQPYRWQVCVQPKGRHLLLAQAYYPGPSHVDRHQARVDEALQHEGGDS